MLQLALDVGFWNRLMGLAAMPARLTLERIQNMALELPTSTILTRAEAGSLRKMALEAHQASAQWVAGKALAEIEIPKVSLPPSPNISGGEPGPIQASLIIAPKDDRSIKTNVIFSMDRETPFQKVLRQVADYAEAHAGESESLDQFLKGLMKNWRTGRKDWILPNYIVEELE